VAKVCRYQVINASTSYLRVRWVAKHDVCKHGSIVSALLLGNRNGRTILIRCVAIALLVSVLMGCATSKGIIERNSGLPGENESVIVVGIAPANNHILFFPGAVKNGVFAQNNFKGSPLFGRPSEGFLVGKVAAGQTLGLTMVQVTPYEKSLAFAKQFSPCGEAKTFAHAPVGNRRSG
jgi:hypothetical protein